jgi:hypothetical protein
VEPNKELLALLGGNTTDMKRLTVKITQNDEKEAMEGPEAAIGALNRAGDLEIDVPRTLARPPWQRRFR